MKMKTKGIGDKADSDQKRDGSRKKKVPSVKSNWGPQKANSRPLGPQASALLRRAADQNRRHKVDGVAILNVRPRHFLASHLLLFLQPRFCTDLRRPYAVRLAPNKQTAHLFVVVRRLVGRAYIVIVAAVCLAVG